MPMRPLPCRAELQDQPAQHQQHAPICLTFPPSSGTTCSRVPHSGFQSNTMKPCSVAWGQGRMGWQSLGSIAAAAAGSGAERCDTEMHATRISGCCTSAATATWLRPPHARTHHGSPSHLPHHHGPGVVVDRVLHHHRIVVADGHLHACGEGHGPSWYGCAAVRSQQRPASTGCSTLGRAGQIPRLSTSVLASWIQVGVVGCAYGTEAIFWRRSDCQGLCRYTVISGSRCSSRAWAGRLWVGGQDHRPACTKPSNSCPRNPGLLSTSRPQPRSPPVCWAWLRCPGRAQSRRPCR